MATGVGIKVSERERLNDQLKRYAPLVQEFRRRTDSESRTEVTRWCRGLSDLELQMVSEQEFLDALDAASDETSTAPQLEGWAGRLELLAEAKDARRTEADDFFDNLFGTRESRGQPERELAANLRRAPEWRAERKAEWERTRPKPRLLEAAALQASCWRDEPLPVRLKRIEEAQHRLGELVKEAKAEGDWEEVPAISEYATSVWRLREALERTGGSEGS